MNREIPVVIFLGAPGAGKGTQATFLAEAKSIPKISTGDMLRNAVHEDSELGRKVQMIMKEGRLVDDETMLSLVKERIGHNDCQNGFILDGYPRNLAQASALETVLTQNMKLIVLNIQVSEDEIVKRIAGRRSCGQCGRVYNVYFRPPESDEKCDVDGAALFQRSDDDESVVRKRLATYKEETLPLIQHYRDRKLLQVINGLQDQDAVRKAVITAAER
jgi:adenylate kinase